MGFLKPKAAKSTSENTNNQLITSTYGGQMNAGTGATNFLAQLLGVAPMGGGGVPAASAGGGTSAPGGIVGAALRSSMFRDGDVAQRIGQGANQIAEAGGATPGYTGGAQAGYNNYLQNAGYAPAMRQLSQGITGQGAASGLLQSGSTAKALQTRGAELNQSFFNNYLQQLAGLSGLGLQAGGLVANTGNKQTSTGGSPSTLGSIASTVGGIASIFSDRRLKRDIERVGEFADGLGIYAYRYVMGTKRVLGVMADEVAKLRPWALGPQRAGYATVNYRALQASGSRDGAL